jgi:SRSO17 transposase
MGWTMDIGRRRLLWAGVAALIALLLCRSAARAAQEKSTLLSGTLYKVHAGFLEMREDEKHIAVVKVDSATVYWDGKKDRAGSRKDLSGGDELMVEVVEKGGALVARKVRFLHRSY